MRGRRAPLALNGCLRTPARRGESRARRPHAGISRPPRRAKGRGLLWASVETRVYEKSVGWVTVVHAYDRSGQSPRARPPVLLQH